ncbi:hypothetical protein BpJC7_23020 [Weizmannia acidilactici]|uniref:Uncharacterized protein n=1 Tax=Weizmannia acidilactici TaxID=2607726 RepID=A0A5J4JI94_9BACI|nr:hypothetical protein BpJC7_23020 [Weizmannia acidilactici]
MNNNHGNKKVFCYIRVNDPSKLSTKENLQSLSSLLTNFLIQYKINSFNGKRNSCKHRIEEYLYKVK